MKRPEYSYWSSCCGQLVGYRGYYYCTGCNGYVHMGRQQSPHFINNRAEADAIAAEREQELTPDGALF